MFLLLCILKRIVETFLIVILLFFEENVQIAGPQPWPAKLCNATKFIYFFVPWHVLLQARGLVQSHFSTEYDLVLPLSISTSSPFLNVIQKLLKFSSSYFRHFYPSNYLTFSNVC